jgi:hypothetical protein
MFHQPPQKHPLPPKLSQLLQRLSRQQTKSKVTNQRKRQALPRLLNLALPPGQLQASLALLA